MPTDPIFSELQLSQLALAMEYSYPGNTYTSSDAADMVDQSNTSTKAKHNRLALIKFLAWYLSTLTD